MTVYHLFLHSKNRFFFVLQFYGFTELRSFFVSVLQSYPQLGDAGVSEHLGPNGGVGVDVLTPSLEMPESVNILALTVGLG